MRSIDLDASQVSDASRGRQQPELSNQENNASFPVPRPRRASAWPRGIPARANLGRLPESRLRPAGNQHCPMRTVYLTAAHPPKPITPPRASNVTWTAQAISHRLPSGSAMYRERPPAPGPVHGFGDDSGTGPRRSGHRRTGLFAPIDVAGQVIPDHSPTVRASAPASAANSSLNAVPSARSWFRPTAPEDISSTQPSTVEQVKALILRIFPSQSPDHGCAAKDSNPEPAD
jgi:hypothetical protein